MVPVKYGLFIIPVLFLSACGPSLPKAKYLHAQFGTVGGDDPRLVSVRNECGNKAYAKGIMINGRKVTDRNTARDAWAKFLVDQAMPSGSAAMAGIQGAMAVQTGNMSYINQPVHRPAIKSPPYSKRMDELEKETADCVAENGFKIKKP